MASIEGQDRRLDGTLARTPETYRVLGRLLGRERDAEERASFAETLLARVAQRVDSVPARKRPRVYYARGPRGLETGRGGSINVESLVQLGAVNVAGETGGEPATVSLEQVLAWPPRRRARRCPTPRTTATSCVVGAHLAASKWLQPGRPTT